MLCVPPDMYEKRLFSVLLTEKEKTKWELVNTKLDLWIHEVLN